jgi:2-polyprenyl-3-methyl-5-hydroxy-6-metoxy-1,4-benzoquinol methylase
MDTNSRKILSDQYVGKHAENYDANRTTARRHLAEDKIFREFFKYASPQTVLDCPVGTLRWIDIYADSAVQVLGVDLSEDMIRHAKLKVDKRGLGHRIEFKRGDILDDERSPLDKIGKSFEMAVCVRFLNWIPTETAFNVIAGLSRHTNSYFLLGATLVPDSWSLFHKLKARWLLFLDNRVRMRKKSAFRFTHNERRFENFLTSLGWTILQKESTITTKDAINYLYLLSKI